MPDFKHATRVNHASGSEGDSAFQGMKSFWFNPRLGMHVAAGHLNHLFQDRLADLLDGCSPRITAPVSISMMSDMRSARLVL